MPIDHFMLLLVETRKVNIPDSVYLQKVRNGIYQCLFPLDKSMASGDIRAELTISVNHRHRDFNKQENNSVYPWNVNVASMFIGPYH